MAVLGGLSACGDTVDNAAFVSAYRAATPAEVTVSGTVTALLPDSHTASGGNHERFDVVVSGITVEVDHNIDLAPRVPLSVGENVVIHGQFEPDPGHPVIHDTHHATGRHPGGYIEAGGQTYS